MLESVLGPIASGLIDALTNRRRLKVKAFAYHRNVQGEPSRHCIHLHVINSGRQPVYLAELGTIANGNAYEMIFTGNDRRPLPRKLEPGEPYDIEFAHTANPIGHIKHCYARDSFGNTYRTPLQRVPKTTSEMALIGRT